MSEQQPDFLTRECWKRDHDRCPGYTNDGELCECQCHDDFADAYFAAMRDDR